APARERRRPSAGHRSPAPLFAPPSGRAGRLRRLGRPALVLVRRGDREAAARVRAGMIRPVVLDLTHLSVLEVLVDPLPRRLHRPASLVQARAPSHFALPPGVPARVFPPCAARKPAAGPAARREERPRLWGSAAAPVDRLGRYEEAGDQGVMSHASWAACLPRRFVRIRLTVQGDARGAYPPRETSNTPVWRSAEIRP